MKEISFSVKEVAEILKERGKLNADAQFKFISADCRCGDSMYCVCPKSLVFEQ